MEEPLVRSTDDSVEKSLNSEIEKSLSVDNFEEMSQESESVNPSSAESVKRASKCAKPNASTLPKGTARIGIAKRRTEVKNGSVANSTTAIRSTLTRPTISSVTRSLGSVQVVRRNSTGGLAEKQPISLLTKRQDGGVSSVAGRKTSSSVSETVRRSLPEIRRSSLPSVGTGATNRTSISDIRKSVPVSTVTRSPRSSSTSDASKHEYLKKTPVRPSPPSVSSTKKVASTSLDSTGSSSVVRKAVGKISSPTVRTPTTGSKGGSFSTSFDKSSNLSSRKKAGTPESRDSRLIMLPQVENKAGDDVVCLLFLHFLTIR